MFNFLIELFSIVTKVFFISLNIIISFRNSFLEFMSHFLMHEILHQEEIILEHSKLPTGHVELIHQLAPLQRQLGVDELVDLTHEQVTLILVVNCTLFFQVEQVLILRSPQHFSFTPLSEFSLAELEETSAEKLEALIEVFK